MALFVTKLKIILFTKLKSIQYNICLAILEAVRGTSNDIACKNYEIHLIVSPEPDV